MTDLSRRTFVHSMATAVPLISASSGGLGQGAPAASGTGLDPAILRALAETVLPTELTPDGMGRVVTSFQAWLDGYDPLAEVDHGYGTSELAYLPPDPAPGWAAQAAALDLEARRRWSRTFTELELQQRRDLLDGHLARERAEGFPAPHQAGHVAIGLMAWFYATPEATDLCYRARIGKETCRDLGQVVAEPAPLGEGA